MMNRVSKYAFSIILVFGLALSLGYAQQTFFGTTPTATPAPTTPNPAAPNTARVMTPEQFKAEVARRSQQTDSAIHQQTLQQLKPPVATPPTPPATPGAPTPPDMSGSTPAYAPPLSTPSSPTAAPPAPAQDVYTGFAPSTPSGTAPAPAPAPKSKSKSTGGGWNINY